MKIGFIGLGRMGSRMVIKLLEGDHEVVVWNRSSSKVEELKSKFKIQPVLDRVETRSGNLKVASSVKDLVNQLDLPRVIWSMLPAGEATEEILDEVEKYVESGDVIIDGGNAFFEDTERRYRHFRKKFVKFLGIGVSGGVIAAR